MRRQGYEAVVVIVVLVLLFCVPVVGASSPGATTGSRIHFTESLGCFLEGGGPHAWLGVYYFQGGFGIGCMPLVV